MEYTKTEWKDFPDTTTPITADRLNNMENGIEYLFENSIPTDSEQIEDNSKLIWLNSNPSQDITTLESRLDESLITLSSDYAILEIFYQQQTNNSISYSSRFLRSSGITRCFIPSTDGMLYRIVTIDEENNTISISSIVGSVNNDNSICIPISVVAYKNKIMNIQ